MGINSSDSKTRQFYAKQAKWFKNEWKKLDMMIFRLKIIQKMTPDLIDCGLMNKLPEEIIEKYGGNNNEF